MTFDLILAIQTYILHDNYELVQACNQYKNICMHNKSGVFLKTNVVLEGVGMYRAALRSEWGGLKIVHHLVQINAGKQPTEPQHICVSAFCIMCKLRMWLWGHSLPRRWELHAPCWRTSAIKNTLLVFRPIGALRDTNIR